MAKYKPCRCADFLHNARFSAQAESWQSHYWEQNWANKSLVAQDAILNSKQAATHINFSHFPFQGTWHLLHKT